MRDRDSLVNRKADESPYEGMNNTLDPLDVNEIRAFFRVMYEITGREDFQFFSSNGEKGCPQMKGVFPCLTRGSMCLEQVGGKMTRISWLPVQTWSEGNTMHIRTAMQGILSFKSREKTCWLTQGDSSTGIRHGRIGAIISTQTAAHNTVQVDEHEMEQFLRLLQMSELYVHSAACFDSTEAVDLVEVSHNAYAYMKEPVFHMRRVIWLKPGLWIVDDVLTGIGNHNYKLYFNFAPGILKKI
jgi:hypothetical protein